MGPKILVMIPAFNEENSISGVVQDVLAAVPEAAVLVVDDGSTDDTARHAKSAGALLLQLPFNLGIGGAVQSGYLYAKRNGYDVAVQIDGDGQHDPVFIRDMLRQLGGCDLVVGSRFLSNEGFRSTATRRVGIGILSGLLKVLTGKRFTDPTSGFRVANRQVIEHCAESYPQDFPEVESLLHLHREGLVIVESPVVMRQRAFGKSSISWTKSLWYMLKVSLSLCIGIARRRVR